YKTYFDGAQFVHFLLGPATVALAVPLFQQWAKLRRHAVPLMAGLLAGSVVAVVSAVGIAWLLGASPETLRSM
ncbi:LrgB family protein, partial [Mycobacterium intracellulare]